MKNRLFAYHYKSDKKVLSGIENGIDIEHALRLLEIWLQDCYEEYEILNIYEVKKIRNKFIPLKFEKQT
ncbi:MAG: hypothetical protein PHS93_09605 [Candidatus Omnitrophica bacterium]|nr:hypothetical protein [Candidatus Omnitrophota bacterium]